MDIPARLVVRCSVSKDISPTGTTSAVVDQDLDGTFLTDRLDPNVAKIQLAEQTLREILSKKPQLLLLDVDLIRIAGETVVLASIQSPRPLIPDEIHLLQKKIRDRLGDSSMRLVARCQVATDVTSRGRILYGRAHFGEQTPGLKQVEKSLRSALACQGEFYVLTNLDVLWEKDHWAVQAEIFGPKVITPNQVKNIEKMTGQAVGKPVKFFAWSSGRANGHGFQIPALGRVHQAEDAAY